MKLSIIIAAWNEGSQIASSLKRLRHISQNNVTEIIVVDGKSEDDTVEQARPWADEVIVHDEPNRGVQFHLGAQKASGDLLLFLRAEAQPPGNWQQALEHFWLSPRHEGVAATVFSVDYGSSPLFRLTSWACNLAARWKGRAGGDHGLCTTPALYKESGGYPPYPCMEDAAFCRRLERLGRIVVLPETIWPAARRMHQAGALSFIFKRLWMGLRYRLGASPEALWRGDQRT